MEERNPVQQAVRIRKAAAGDRAAVLDLLRRSGLPLEGLHDHWHTLLVANAADHLVGTAALECYADGALLRSVAVDPAYRGRGIGRLLTEAALSLAADHGTPRVVLLTETAADFFPRFGFRPISRDEVPAGVKGSVEFTSACPASARVLARNLTD